MGNVESKIKLVAYELISRRPVENITTEEIIRTAKVAKASFYYYFRDKYDVAVFVLKDTILSALKKPDNTSLPWRTRILNIYAAMLENQHFLKNVLKVTMPYYIYYDLVEYYSLAFTVYLRALGVDVDSFIMSNAIEILAFKDITCIFQFARGKFQKRELGKITQLWYDTLPHVIHEVLANKKN